MITIRGNYAEAIIYADAVEPEARRQVQELCDQPFAADSHIRIMPDAHPGKGCVIGLTMTYTGKIVPNLVGVDIGCGIRTIRIAEKTFDPERLDRIIRQNIPSGFNIRKAPHALVERVNLDQL
ncbi:MAG TPA: RtcB family protein, partial [Clostridiales bacterium]|nr:RtcB family protein [Clostridiales bacterium]